MPATKKYVEIDHDLNAKVEDFTWQLIQHRYAWVSRMGGTTLNQNARLYADAVGVGPGIVMTDYRAFELRNQYSDLSVFELRQMGKLSADRQLATTAVAKARGVSVSTVISQGGREAVRDRTSGQRSNRNDVIVGRNDRRDVDRVERVIKSTPAGQDPVARAERVAKVQEDVRQSRKKAIEERPAEHARALALMALERALDKARINLADAVRAARQVGTAIDTDRKAELMDDLKRLTNRINLVSLAISDEVNSQIDWDQELAALTS